MVRVEDGRRRLAVALGGALVCALATTSPGLGAPTVSPGEGHHFNTVPSFAVVPDGSGQIMWTLRGPDGAGADGAARPSPTLAISFPARLMADGTWQLTVEQSGEATTRTFVIDRTAPGAVTLSGPASVVSGQAAPFTWTGGEADASYTWRVTTAGGATVIPPAQVVTPLASVPPLAAGSYLVAVAQVDRAGNPSAEALAPLAVTPPPPPVAPTVVAPPVATPVAPLRPAPVTVTIMLPSSHADRLSPRRSAVVRTVRPMLRWKGAPKGTTLYNVQIFRVDDRRAASSNAVALKKLRSVFPRTNRMRTPRLRRGACYVWRVWPYRGDDFTRKPLGVSNFCVAKARRSAKR
jgi:hypothetical protein